MFQDIFFTFAGYQCLACTVEELAVPGITEVLVEPLGQTDINVPLHRYITLQSLLVLFGY